MRPGPGLGLFALATLALGFGGCAQSPQQIAASSHGREYFPASVYGRASPRVIADGQPVPHGGGQYLVGKPYTIAGRTYYPSENRKTQVGLASWYGDAFHGRLTANGEIYDRDSFTAASPVLPLPSYVRVTNLRNNYSMIVRVNDRGPYASDRIMDVSRRVAEALDFKRTGTTTIKVDYVGRAGLSGSDDTKLYATLRTNGAPSQQQPSIMVAESVPRLARVASLDPYVPPAPEPPREVRPRALAWHEEDMPRDRFTAPPERRRVARFADQEPDIVPPPRGRAGWSDDRTATLHGRDDERGEPRSPVRPPARPRFAAYARQEPQPPSRPLDLGTIPGAASRIHAPTRPTPLRLTRASDD